MGSFLAKIKRIVATHKGGVLPFRYQTARTYDAAITILGDEIVRVLKTLNDVEALAADLTGTLLERLSDETIFFARETRNALDDLLWQYSEIRKSFANVLPINEEAERILTVMFQAREDEIEKQLAELRRKAAEFGTRARHIGGHHDVDFKPLLPVLNGIATFSFAKFRTMFSTREIPDFLKLLDTED